MKKINSAVQLNKLGVSHFAQNEFEKAVTAFKSAIEMQPDYTDAYYNLGLALRKLQRYPEAMHAYEALIELLPQHLGGRFQLGCLFMEQNNLKMAIEQFVIIDQLYPQHVEAQINLATCYLKLGRLGEAKSHYLKVIILTPGDIQALFNLGVISTQQGYLAEAIDFYLRVLQQDPNFHDAHNNLGVAYLERRDLVAALAHFRAALHIQPSNVIARHMVHVLMRDKKIASSPPDYIRSLFDAYADYYDAHLLNRLDYQVPQRLLQMVEMAGCQADLKIVDLGCGTGLSGELFKSYASTLVGVDLSAKMLAVAATKRSYDELIEADLLAFLKDKKVNYDLIVAGDVLVYFGDLTALFAAVAQALTLQGRFVFNAEISDSEDYLMTFSGRFSHRRDYIEQLAAQYQLRVVQYQLATMRTHQGNDVQGHFYLLERQA